MIRGGVPPLFENIGAVLQQKIEGGGVVAAFQNFGRANCLRHFCPIHRPQYLNDYVYIFRAVLHMNVVVNQVFILLYMSKVFTKAYSLLTAFVKVTMQHYFDNLLGWKAEKGIQLCNCRRLKRYHDCISIRHSYTLRVPTYLHCILATSMRSHFCFWRQGVLGMDLRLFGYAAMTCVWGRNAFWHWK